MIYSPLWLLTPCGTSMLTNGANSSQRELLFKYANHKTEDHIPTKDKDVLNALIKLRHQQLLQQNRQQASQSSAELNAIIQYLADRQFPHSHHCLLPTDTWLGKKTASIIESWIQKNISTATTELKQSAGLQTENFAEFQLALSDLSAELISDIDTFRQNRHHIGFNLTGGFKAIIGFLQVLATCYADEAFYIFERSEHLLIVPKLPVKFTSNAIFEQHLNLFRKLELGTPLNSDELTTLPQLHQTLIHRDGNQAILSALGQIQWQNLKKDIYSKAFYPPPSDKIKIAKSFWDDVSAKQIQQNSSSLYELNKRMDELSKYLENSDFNPKSLSFKSFKAHQGIYQLYAWSDRGAKRIYGKFEQQNIFLIESLDNHS